MYYTHNFHMIYYTYLPYVLHTSLHIHIYIEGQERATYIYIQRDFLLSLYIRLCFVSLCICLSFLSLNAHLYVLMYACYQCLYTKHIYTRLYAYMYVNVYTCFYIVINVLIHRLYICIYV